MAGSKGRYVAAVAARGQVPFAHGAFCLVQPEAESAGRCLGCLWCLNAPSVFTWLSLGVVNCGYGGSNGSFIAVFMAHIYIYIYILYGNRLFVELTEACCSYKRAPTSCHLQTSRSRDVPRFLQHQNLGKC